MTVQVAFSPRLRMIDNELALARAARAERRRLFLLVMPALVIICVTVIAPTAWLFFLSFVGEHGEVTLENYRLFFTAGSYTTVMITTLKVSFIVVALCALLGYPLSYFLAQLPDRVATIFMIAVVLPYMTSVLVRTYAWLVLLQRRGLVNSMLISLGWTDGPLLLVHNLTGTVIGMVHVLLPFFVLALYSSMKAINRDCMRAAASLGAGPIAAFWKVYFPLSLPGFLAGSFLVFALSLGFFISPSILGGGRVIMMAQQIATAVSMYAHWGAASALAVVLLVATFAVLYAAHRIVRLYTQSTVGSRP